MIENYLNQLNKFFQTYGKLINFKKWEYIYKENDKNIYFLTEWEAAWILKNKIIFYIKAKEISWEKSFLENKNKPLKLKVISNTATVYKITPENFEKLNLHIKIEFIKTLTLYTSERVYRLNSILSHIKNISEIILSTKSDFTKTLCIFWKIENRILFEKNDDLIFINWNIYPDCKILNFVEKYKDQEIKIWKNFLIFSTKKYLYLLSWNIYDDRYIISNTILYSKWLFEYIWDLIKKQKEKKLNDLLTYQH